MAVAKVPQRNTANTAPAPTSAPAPIRATAAAPELLPDAEAEAVFDPPEEPVLADPPVVEATVGVGVTTLVTLPLTSTVMVLLATTMVLRP